MGLTRLTTFFTSETPFTAALPEVNLSQNKCFNAESVKALADAIPTSKIETLVIGKDCLVPVAVSDVTTLDCSNQNLGPGELMLISSVVIPVSTALSEVNLETNPAITTAEIEDLQKSHPNISFTT